MEQYFVHLDNQPNSYEETEDIINDAFKSRSSLHVSGIHEGVEVDYDLTVMTVGQRRLGPKAVLAFTGITLPEKTHYRAEYSESGGPNPIDLRILSEINLAQAQ